MQTRPKPGHKPRGTGCLVLAVFVTLAVLCMSTLAMAADTGKVDRSGQPVAKVNEDGALDVFIQDQFSPVVNRYFTTPLPGTVTLTSPTALDDTVLAVQTGYSSTAVGNLININEGSLSYQGTVLSNTPTSLTMDTPLDHLFTTAAMVNAVSKQMAIDCSTTPVSFFARPPPGVKWDITRVIYFIEGSGAMDSAKFGDITALTKGVVFRKKDGDYNNIFNVKSNGDFANQAYDITYDSKAPAGSTAVRIRRSIGGQDKNGVVVRLDGATADELQNYCQDDISGLNNFFGILQGHEVVD